jgi:hypothetical protein
LTSASTADYFDKIAHPILNVITYQATIDSKYNKPIAKNKFKCHFNPQTQNRVYAFIKTDESWLYLTIVMNLFSRQIVGFAFYVIHITNTPILFFPKKMRFKIQYIDFN